MGFWAARRRFWEGEWVGVRGGGGRAEFGILGTVLEPNLQRICLGFGVVPVVGKARFGGVGRWAWRFAEGFMRG